MRLWNIAALIFTSLVVFRCTPQPEEIDLGNAYTFKAYPLEIEMKPNEVLNAASQIIISHLGDDIRIMPVDTGMHRIEVVDIEQCTLSKVYRLSATPHPLYDPAWEDPEAPRAAMLEEQARVHNNWRTRRHPRNGRAFPSFKIKDADGIVLDNTVLEGKITHINTWQYGCMPCMEEIPNLNTLKASYADDPDVQFLAFYRDSVINDGELITYYAPGFFQSDRHASQWMDLDIDFTYRQIPLAKAFLDSADIRSAPQHFIVDAKGIIRFHIIGASGTDNTSHAEQLGRQIELAKCAFQR
ncbi:MAG: TlpA family protein disulfide reductase [Flavobacteriales bacterium]|nr:TlpA family protein disulfide reductase [Flavobacteriales bacterium]